MQALVSVKRELWRLPREDLRSSSGVGSAVLSSRLPLACRTVELRVSWGRVLPLALQLPGAQQETEAAAREEQLPAWLMAPASLIPWRCEGC